MLCIKVDIIVVELMDCAFFGESIINVILDARQRLLAESGVVIPESVR